MRTTARDTRNIRRVARLVMRDARDCHAQRNARLDASARRDTLGWMAGVSGKTFVKTNQRPRRKSAQGTRNTILVEGLAQRAAIVTAFGARRSVKLAVSVKMGWSELMESVSLKISARETRLPKRRRTAQRTMKCSRDAERTARRLVIHGPPNVKESVAVDVSANQGMFV